MRREEVVDNGRGALAVHAAPVRALLAAELDAEQPSLAVDLAPPCSCRNTCAKRHAETDGSTSRSSRDSIACSWSSVMRAVLPERPAEVPPSPAMIVASIAASTSALEVEKRAVAQEPQ